MPIPVYRIQKKQFVSTLLSGEGARLYGGRWNPVGVPLVYTSASPELALLETLVHLDGTPLSDLPPYVQVTLALPDNSIEYIAENDLPASWDSQPAPDYLSHFLLPRLQVNSPFLAFAVPSSVLPGSPTRNILLNSQHPLINQVELVSVKELEFDGRLRPSPAIAPILPTSTKSRPRAKPKQ